MSNRFWIVSILACLSGLAVSELLARRWLGLGDPPLYEASPEYEYRLKPHQSLRRFGNDFQTNSFGLRSPELSPLRPQGRRRVLILGDSIVWGGSQLDQRFIATELIRERLDVDIANVSAPSWGPANQLSFIKTHGLQNSTDVVLVISSHDAHDVPTFKPLAQSLDKPTVRPWFALQEGFQRYLIPRLPGVTRQAPASAEVPGSALESLDQLIQHLRQAGVRLSVLQFWDRSETITGQPGVGHRQIAAVLARNNVVTIQTGPIFKTCGPLATLFVDSIHPYTRTGQACLAHALELAIKDAQ